MQQIVLLSFLLVIAACTRTGSPTTPVEGRWYASEQVELGRGLYETYCADCHGADGSATSSWRTVGADGHYPPPPLNGTAHTWHHPISVLDDTIANGGVQFGGVMPGFGSTLGEDDRLSVIAWIQSLWPDEVYGKWQEIDARSR